MTAVVVGEQPLVVGLDAVVELLDQAVPELADDRLGVHAREQHRQHPEQQVGVVEVGRASPRSTPGYCTLTATARPSWVMARCTWPIDADAIGVAVPLGEHLDRVRRRARRG